MISAVQFLRLADQLSAVSDPVRRTIEALARGDESAAAAAAGGRGSDSWWGAEFFLSSLAQNGIERCKAQKRSAPMGAALFPE